MFATGGLSHLKSLTLNEPVAEALTQFLRYLIVRVFSVEPVNEIPPVSFRLPLNAASMELYVRKVHNFYSLGVFFYGVGKRFHRGVVWPGNKAPDTAGKHQVL